MTEALETTPEKESADEGHLELREEVERAIVLALDSKDHDKVRELAADLYYADLADLIERITPEERDELIEIMGDDLPVDVIAELDVAVRDDVFDEFDTNELAEVVTELDTDDAVMVVEELEEHEKKELLEAIPPENRNLIEEALAHPEDSAGRMMQREFVAAPEFWTVGETIDFVRGETNLPDRFFNIFIVDPAYHPLGVVPLSHLMRSSRETKLQEIMQGNLKTIPVEADQEEVAFLFRQRDLVSAPVVGAGGRMVGVITVDDVVDVIDEEHEEDIMRLGGVTEDDLYDSVVDTTKARFAWLLVNLGTAIVASVVIGLFDATIEQIVALAVLMPIVASMGGNAGTQTLTVAVRALAMKEVSSTNALRIIVKELTVGGVNGVLFAILSGAAAWVWFGSGALAMVIAAAMVINMVVAGLAGAAIPLALERLKIDPAVASSVFLTTITDVVGFFAFLGLAALFLL